jgi:pimeloyl-ACP methyl ester carboxylesterase
MPITTVGSNTAAATHFRRRTNTTYAYRRFGSKPGRPLLFPEHFTGHARQLGLGRDRPLASGRDLILFDNAGVGRSTGNIPRTVAGAAAQALDFLDCGRLDTCDVLGFSLGGMIAQQMPLERPSMFRWMTLVDTAPRGGDDITKRSGETARAQLTWLVHIGACAWN